MCYKFELRYKKIKKLITDNKNYSNYNRGKNILLASVIKYVITRSHSICFEKLYTVEQNIFVYVKLIEKFVYSMRFLLSGIFYKCILNQNLISKITIICNQFTKFISKITNLF